MLYTVQSDFVTMHRQEILTTLQELLQIESVKSDAKLGAPFGVGPARALDYVLTLAAKHGLTVKNVDGYAGHVEYGEGEDYIGVLSHLDVVPAGTGWTTPPFAAEVRDGKIYARGAIDDKGPALSSLWALISLKEQGIRPRRKIRLIFGMDEESHWECVKYYFNKEAKPLGGFTPDADFPLIYAEKGLLNWRLSVNAQTDSLSPRVIHFEGGSRVNMVPDNAYAVIDCFSETAARDWEQRLLKEARSRQIDMEVNANGSRLQVVVHGKSAHASLPDMGTNAIVGLANLLATQAISNGFMWRTIASQDTAGRALGIACHDEVTGYLTSNLGRAELKDNVYSFDFDIRYPIDKSLEELYNSCSSYLSELWAITMLNEMSPLYVPLDSPVVQTLLGVYRNFTQDDTEPLTIGGATYARAVSNVVAFGPMRPGQEDVAHQKDENWRLDEYYLSIQIYAQAMNEFANIL